MVQKNRFPSEDIIVYLSSVTQVNMQMGKIPYHPRHIVQIEENGKSSSNTF